MTPNVLTLTHMVRYGVRGVLYQIQDSAGALRVEGFAQTVESVLPLFRLFGVRVPSDDAARA